MFFTISFFCLSMFFNSFVYNINIIPCKTLKLYSVDYVSHIILKVDTLRYKWIPKFDFWQLLLKVLLKLIYCLAQVCSMQSNIKYIHFEKLNIWINQTFNALNARLLYHNKQSQQPSRNVLWNWKGFSTNIE